MSRELVLDNKLLLECIKSLTPATSTSDDSGMVVSIKGDKDSHWLTLTCAHVKLSVSTIMPLDKPLDDDLSLVTSFPLLSSIARNIDGDVKLVIDGATVTASGKGLRATLPLRNGLTIRDIVEEGEEVIFLMQATLPQLDNAFKKITWAADLKSENPSFVSPHILKGAAGTYIVGTDTKVMAVYEIEDIELRKQDIAIPVHFISAVLRCGMAKDETLNLYTDPSSTRIMATVQKSEKEYPRITIGSPLIWGQFPTFWEKLMIQSDKCPYQDYSIVSDEIKSCFKRGMDLVAAQQSSKEVQVNLHFEGGVCDVEIVGVENQIHVEFLYAEDEGSGVVDITLDPNFVLGYLQHVDGEVLEMRVPTQPVAQVLFTDGAYRSAIMPIRRR